jgi:hypothetical protein
LISWRSILGIIRSSAQGEAGKAGWSPLIIQSFLSFDENPSTKLPRWQSLWHVWNQHSNHLAMCHSAFSCTKEVAWKIGK